MDDIVNLLGPNAHPDHIISQPVIKLFLVSELFVMGTPVVNGTCVVPGSCELRAKVVIQDWYVNRVALQYYTSTTYNLTSKTEEYSFARELPDG